MPDTREPDRNDAQEDVGYLSVAKLMRQVQDYFSLKTEERREAREARLYYHGSPWTKDQLAILRQRGQLPTVTPALARKINGFVGLLEKLRQDPKAYPRTPHEEQGATLCTAALRYALEQQEWMAKTPIITRHAAVDAIGGVEIGLTPGDSGQPGDFDVEIDIVDPATFFYDARSFTHDFSDARFKGVAKWVDLDWAIEKFPGKEDELESVMESGGMADIDADRHLKFANSSTRQVMLVEHWYKRRGRWLWAFYVGNVLLDQGVSYLVDEKKQTMCRFVMWRAFIDQDGDSYGFHRYMKSLVDEINQRNSKAMHLLSMRRIKMETGAVDDVDELRRQAVRPDGVIVVNKGFELEFEDAKSLADMKGQLEMKEAARQELENFGPNPALVGQGVQSKSGRAIALLQQAGLAELGPFTTAYRGWKIRVYRAVWNAIRQHWTAERWIRVTDIEGKQQPVQINAQQVDPVTGAVQMINQIGALDVDIIIDEGPDAVNMQADALEVLQTAQARGAQMPPGVMIELLPLPDQLKQKLLGMIQQGMQPPPEKQEAAKLQLAQMAADVDKTKADTFHSMARGRQAMTPQQMDMGQAPQQDQPSPVDIMEALAGVEDKHASAYLKYAQADKVRMETHLAPRELVAKAQTDKAKIAAMNRRQPTTQARNS